MPEHLLFVRWKHTQCSLDDFRTREPPIWRNISTWIKWRAEFIYRTLSPDNDPPWVQEIKVLPKIRYYDPDDPTKSCGTHHFRHPWLGTLISNGLAAALIMATLGVPHHCHLVRRQFIALPLLWEFSQDSFLPLNTETDAKLVDQFDRAWAALRALTYSHQVTFSNDYLKAEEGERHDEYKERIRILLLGKPYRFQHSLLAEAYRDACSPFVDLPLEHVRPFSDYNRHFV